MAEHEYDRKSPAELALIADSYNCDLVTARPNELLLDLDIPFKQMWDNPFLIDLHRAHQVPSTVTWRSRNGRTHILLVLGEEVSPAERIAWQLLLGSDPKREVGLLHDIQKVAPDGSTNCLFKPKESV